jgi:hypothetical protein
MMDDRLRAVCDLLVASVREECGRHEYDGQAQDLSDAGVAPALARVGVGARRADPLLEAHLGTFEDAVRTRFGELRTHHVNPILHIANLDVSCYDRPYAPAPERQEARRRHLTAWPDAVDTAVATLDAVPAPVAAALVPVARGLGAELTDADPVEAAALAALDRFVAHLDVCARDGDPDPALGPAALAAAMGAGEALVPDLGALADAAERERARLRDELAAACGLLDASRPPRDVVAELQRDCPSAYDDLSSWTAELVDELTAHCRALDLVPHLDGELRIGPPPASREWALAMMIWAAPDEPDGPSWYWITAPNASWDAEDLEAYRSVFCRTTLPSITAHEVVPGHFAHARSLRHVDAPERRVLLSQTFIEGWAHYAEEMLVDIGFRESDPRFRIGVYIEALVRITRLSAAIGLHTGAMTLHDATELFQTDALLSAPTAASEARRGLFEPNYGRYAWGKLAIRDVAAKARAAWGERFTLSRLHRELLSLGSPPLGLLEAGLGLR